ncbi:spermatogenesis-associated protein 31E1-like [Hyaena hyaena]|nr:spermatogenesis-associated protein 31E1-like [Hyaena hyaena]
MENILLALKSMSAGWLSSSPSSWTTGTTFAFLCGLWLFLLLISCFQTDPSSSPPRRKRRLSRKQVELRRRSIRDKKKSELLKACRDCLQELDGVRDLVSLLQSHRGRRPDHGGLPQPLGQEGPGDVCEAAPAGAQRPCGGPVKDVAPTTPGSASPTLLASTPSPSPPTSSVSVRSNSSLSPSWLPESLLPPDGFSALPLGPSPSPPCLPSPEAGPPPQTASPTPPRPDSTLALLPCKALALPLNAVPRSPCWRTAGSAAPLPGLGRPSCPGPALSWWWAAQAWGLSASTRLESRQGPPAHRHPEALFWRDPNTQAEPGVLSFIDPDVQKLLEILITKRSELRIWKEKEKEEGSDSHLHPLGSVFTSPRGKPDTVGCRPLWSMQGGPQQLLGPEKPPYPEVRGGRLQPVCSQLFWGLPILHSESLVATVSLTGSPLDLTPVIFNEPSHALSFQIQDSVASHPSPAQPFPHTSAEPQALTPGLTQPQDPPPAQVEPQAQPAPSVPTGLPSLPPQMAGEAADPPVQDNTPPFIPNAIQNLESHFLKKQLERSRTLPSVVKRSQEVFSQVLPDFPQDSEAPQTPRTASVLPCPSGDSIAPELREHLEQHFWKKSMKQQDGGTHKIQHSVELSRPHGELPKASQAQSGSRQAAQKTRPRRPARTMPGKSLGKDTGPSVGGAEKDLHRSLTSSSLKVSRISSEGSDLTKPRTSGPDQNHPEKLLRAHLGRKSGQIREGQIPVGIHQSRLGVNHASDLPAKPSAHRETGNLAFSKCPEPCVNISHDFSILSPYTQRMLEAHIIRFRVKHRWGLPLRVLKPLSLFKLKKSSIFPPPSTPCLATCPPKARAKAKFLENPPQPHQGGVVITEESVPTLRAPLLAPQPAREEVQAGQALGRSSSGDGRGPSGVPLAGREAGPHSQTPTYSFVGRIWHSEIGAGALENLSLEASPGPAMATDEPMRESGGWTSWDSCCSVKVLDLGLESQSSRAREGSAWGDSLDPSESIHADVRRLGSSGSSQGLSTPTALAGLGQDKPKGVELRGLAGCAGPEGRGGSVLLQDCERGVLLQDCETGVLLQDCETGVLLQDCVSNELLEGCRSDVLLAADVLASHGSLPGFPSESSTDTSTSQTILHFRASAQNSEGQRGPLRPPGLRKTQSGRPDRRDDRWRFSLGGRDKWLAELRAFQASVMHCPPRDQESAEILRSELGQLLPKEAAPPESRFRRRMRRFLQWIFPSKGKRPEDSPRQGEPAPTPAQRPGSGSGISVEDDKTQVLMTAMGHILEEKTVPHRGLRASEFNWCKRELQAQAGPGVCYHKVLSYQEQRRVMRETASKGHGCPNKAPCVRGRDSKWAFVPQTLGSPGTPCHHGPMGARASGRPHHPHCPRHCLLQKHVPSGHSACAAHAFLGKTPFLQERMHTVQRKTYFSQVSTSSMD